MPNLREVARPLLVGAVVIAFGSSAAARGRTETAVLAGGCYWGMESVFEHVKGVTDVTSGFAGGVKSGFGRSGERSGFAEAVRIRYDPSQVSYQQLLVIFFKVAHDPTQVDRQGPDVGPRYRSAIFPQNSAQRQIAGQYIATLAASKRYAKPIATNLESGAFQAAEPSQQDYVRRHPKSNYVIVNDLPKLAALRSTYPQYWVD